MANGPGYVEFVFIATPYHIVNLNIRTMIMQQIHVLLCLLRRSRFDAK
ncbi:hypothetical protein [Paracoccus lutimaris]|nr:hypothetical protein [Paracoccus lutimaris]